MRIKMNRLWASLLALIMAVSLAGCGDTSSVSATPEPTPMVTATPEPELIEPPATATPAPEETSTPKPEVAVVTEFDINSIPAYSGMQYVIVNDNVPYFTDSDMTTETFENYSPLDEYGRCGVAYANICTELMPTEDRESISDVTPSGWDNNPYDFVDGGYVYNRCHLIGFQLAGENANELNLITGTRSMNVDGMLPYENMVADYVQETNNHVLYRVTPIYEGANLVASGVLMEAESVEDEGDGVEFCVYCYNVEPGVEIDYATGANWASGDAPSSEQATQPTESAVSSADTSTTETVQTHEYVLNTNTMKFHYPECRSVKQMNDKNRQDVEATRDELIARGYEPCGNCNP